MGARALRAVAIGLLLGGALVALIRWTSFGPLVHRAVPPPVAAPQQAASGAAMPAQAASAPPPAASVQTARSATRELQLAIEAAARGLPASLDTLDDLLHREFNAANTAAAAANVAPTKALQEEHVARLRTLLAMRASAPTGDAGRAVLLTHLARALYRMQRFDELRSVAEEQHRALVTWYLEAMRASATPVVPPWLGLAAIGSVTMATHFGFADPAFADMLPRAQEAYGILEQLLPRDADELALAYWLKDQLAQRRRFEGTLYARAAQLAF